MAEDDQQDLSMEDILSSIKNILAEDEQSNKPQAAPSAETAAPVAAAPVQADIVSQPEPEDEIIDLSPYMRITDDSAGDDINLDAELDGPSPAADSITPADNSADFSAAGEDEPLHNNIPEMAETVYDDASDPFYEEPGVSQNPADYLDAEPRPDFSVTASETAIAAEAEDMQAVEAEPVVAAEDPAVLEPVIPSTEPEPAPEPVAFEAEPQPQEVSGFTETTALAAEDISAAGEAKADSAVDVSASIISNFAKMFTREAETSVEPEVSVAAETEPVRRLGDGAKTIEDVVADVIRGIIGSEVAQNWRQGADYDSFAREEIARQTRLWLDSNLPAVVERTVKEEIERVMAKVGR